MGYEELLWRAEAVLNRCLCTCRHLSNFALRFTPGGRSAAGDAAMLAIMAKAAARGVAKRPASVMPPRRCMLALVEAYCTA